MKSTHSVIEHRPLASDGTDGTMRVLANDRLSEHVERYFTRDVHGVWAAPQQATVSYPATGNEACFQLEDASFWFRHRNACLLEWVRSRSPEGIFLDIGGGNGYVTQALLGAGCNAWLLEPGLDGCANARRRGIQNVLRSTLNDAQLPDGCIDAAGMFDVLEHVNEEQDFLREVHRVLVPGGWLFATVPALSWLWSASDDAAGHKRRYSRASACSALKQAGFKVERISYFFAVLLPPLFLLRTLPYHFRGRGKGKNVLKETTEHGAGGGGTPAVLQRLLAWEAGVLARPRGRLPFGTSLMWAAQKPE